MISKTIAAALLTTALMTGVASAQTATANKEAANASASMHRDGEWRASKLAGVNVYNEANEKIGDINDVILDKSGKADESHPRRRRLSGHGRTPTSRSHLTRSNG